MKILIVNTSDLTGGAAVASFRLMEALTAKGLHPTMLVANRTGSHPAVKALPNRWRHRLNFLWERWCIFCHLHFKRQHLFEIDMANAGTDITRLPEFQQADVVHLEWINQGMLSLRGIEKILQSGKPVVWTMHDLWPLSSLCHYAEHCNGFKHACGNCNLLPGGGSSSDLSHRVMERKKRLLANHRISFVACSEWLAAVGRQSALAHGQEVVAIPNCINTTRFCPGDKLDARRRLGLPAQQRLLLFVSQRVTDERKGMRFFVEAMRLLAAEREKENSLVPDCGVMVLGGHADEVAHQLAIPVYALGYVADEERIIDIYRAADVYVLPSLADNLPNTIMEAMACGTPCVGFRTGGIPEMIDGEGNLENGYVAQPADAADLLQGILHVLDPVHYETLAANAVEKVNRCWAMKQVAASYTSLYKRLLENKQTQTKQP